MPTPQTRPQALLTSIGWFWLVNAGTILFLLLGLLLSYPLYGDVLAGWVVAPPLPGMEPVLWIGEHLVLLLLVHIALSLYALVPSIAILRFRAWARRQLEWLSWASIGYTLGLVWMYFHFWFSLLAATGDENLALSPALFYVLILGIGLGLGLMIGLPFVIVAHFLRRGDLRAATH